MRIKTVSRYRPIIVTPSQCLAILNQLEPLQLTLTVLVAATGLRISEALGLQWQDIDFEGQQIHIRRRYTCGDIDDPKTEASKAVVPLHSALAAYLLRWKQTTPWNKQGDWLFASERLQGKRPRVSGMLAQDYLRPAALKAGVQIAEGQRFGFHNLRHSLSTLLVTKLKEDPKTVQAILRHANIKTTLQIYTQSMSDDRLTAQGRVMDAIFQTTQVGQERVQ